MVFHCLNVDLWFSLIIIVTTSPSACMFQFLISQQPNDYSVIVFNLLGLGRFELGTPTENKECMTVTLQLHF